MDALPHERAGGGVISAGQRSAPALTYEEVRAAVAALLEREQEALRPDDDLIGQGLDSISVMRLVGAWRRQGAEVTFAELMERPRLRAWAQLLQARIAAPAPTLDPPPAELDEQAPFELAPLQLAYWIGRGPEQALGVAAHFYAELDGGDVDPTRLERAVRGLMARHGMLRCRITEEGTGAIAEEGAWTGLTVHDVSMLDPEARAERLAELRERGSHRRLALEGGKGFDFTLTLLGGGATRLHIDLDMVVGDAQSFRILLSDLATLYESGSQGLAPLHFSFPRYLAERASAREEHPERAERAREYWQRRLDELPGPPQLPLATEPERVSAPRITRRFCRLADVHRERLAARAAEHGVTLSIVFATAFAEVLAAWSATPHFVLNLPFYDRELLHPDVERLVGDFTNVILLEVDATVEASFAERARAVQEQLRRDALHSEHSGLSVLRELARRRGGDCAEAPVVFTSAISLGELFDARVRRSFGDPAWTTSQTPGVWLDHQVTEREGGLYLNWDAVEELFADGVLDAMFGAYEGLLDWLAVSDWGGGLPDLVPGSQLA
ncbi:MAG TPA: condensation domain-containing protein, partial [Solirubrobacteraceae bacterium]|nr:condensation domain-containing protein [Solirubrobacteraceae bacterium]